MAFNGHVYVAACPDGLVKVGYTMDPKQRQTQIKPSTMMFVSVLHPKARSLESNVLDRLRDAGFDEPISECFNCDAATNGRKKK